MFYGGLAIAVAIISLLVLLRALKTLFSGGWLMGWLKGTLGLALVVLSAIIGLFAWDVFSYHELLTEKSVATISFKQLEDQHYQAILVNADGVEQKFELKGDQWQLDARIFKWQPSLARYGLKPGYRLDRLAGRYFSLEEERLSERTVYDLNPSISGVDAWRWYKMVDQNIPWLDALYGSATYVPMSDGALYEINLTHSGLISRPLNEPAEVAIRRWQ
ncbi:cation/multidrug efflux pump [Aestuariicella hydrocarbonica]|uniref:Cation/multidrug efflux pump n=1 Tax=Pseudomaricurvus hydrocarbonicus TaxID=1470433 RepID=A0A9E5JVL2_9GAMM|nr:cation/multidrug efflux pump [Aestuariicella hydrocarbonica]NHO65355.1 cation/multidrug efflux pump [Aestuariicella hydrocarbonica]